jgi:hypothetical protein
MRSSRRGKSLRDSARAKSARARSFLFLSTGKKHFKRIDETQFVLVEVVLRTIHIGVTVFYGIA